MKREDVDIKDEEESMQTEEYYDWFCIIEFGIYSIYDIDFIFLIYQQFGW